MTIFLTRREYDKLAAVFPAYMKSDWIEMPKSWSVDGVTITTARQERADALLERLTLIREMKSRADAIAPFKKRPPRIRTYTLGEL